MGNGMTPRSAGEMVQMTKIKPKSRIQGDVDSRDVQDGAGGKVVPPRAVGQLERRQNPRVDAPDVCTREPREHLLGRTPDARQVWTRHGDRCGRQTDRQTDKQTDRQTGMDAW